MCLTIYTILWSIRFLLFFVALGPHVRLQLNHALRNSCVFEQRWGDDIRQRWIARCMFTMSCDLALVYFYIFNKRCVVLTLICVYLFINHVSSSNFPVGRVGLRQYAALILSVFWSWTFLSSNIVSHLFLDLRSAASVCEVILSVLWVRIRAIIILRERLQREYGIF